MYGTLGGVKYKAPTVQIKYMNAFSMSNLKSRQVLVFLGHNHIHDHKQRELSTCCETQRFPDQKLSSPIFTCRSFVRPSRIGDISTLTLLYDVLDHTNQIFSESL